MTVSIPPWFDFVDADIPAAPVVQLFQFHPGSISSNKLQVVIEDARLVSIPPWFDFVPNSLSIRLGRKTFQFHPGSISSYYDDPGPRYIVAFQFHPGSISS